MRPITAWRVAALTALAFVFMAASHVTVSAFATWGSVSLAGTHACAINSTFPGDPGDVNCAGSNDDGQLGTGSRVERTTPVRVDHLGKAVRVATGGGPHSCALTVDKRLWCWGGNKSGEVGDGSRGDRGRPVQVLDEMFLDENRGTFSAGAHHTCAIQDTGRLWCWGSNSDGQLGNRSTVSSRVPVPVSGPSVGDRSGWVEVAAGEAHTCGIFYDYGRDDYTVWCWGRNSNGQLGTGDTAPTTDPVQVDGTYRLTGPVQQLKAGARVEQLKTGASHTCAVIRDDGDRRAWCWGANGSGQLGNGTSADSSRPLPVPTLVNVRGVAGGSAHTCALENNGSVWCWGANESGQLGEGTTSDRRLPTLAAGPLSMLDMSVGARASCGLGIDFKILCWGDNSNGQFANGTKTGSSTPVAAWPNP